MDFYLRFSSDSEVKLTFQELCDNAKNYLWGAYDTTRFTLTIAMWEAHLNHEARDLVKREVNQVCPTGFPSMAQVMDRKEVPQLNAFTTECLRLHVPFPVLSNFVTEPITLNGYTIQPGTWISSTNFADHLNPDLFPEAMRFEFDKFKPERWIKHYETSNVDPKNFIPFGFGARSCPGERVARLDIHLFLR
jgi:cytochrome P450